MSQEDCVIAKFPKKRRFAEDVHKYIKEFPDLIYDGAKIICSVCNKPLFCRDKFDCKKHIKSAQHNYKKSGENAYSDFLFDLIFMLTVCNLPFALLAKEEFRKFWNTYNCKWKLPSRSTLQNHVTSVRDKIENNIKYDLENKMLWLCVGVNTDSKKNSVVNVVVRTLESCQPSFSVLLASKRLEKCTSEAILRVILNTLTEFQLSTDQVLMLMTDGAPTMFCVGRSLKNVCSNLIHVTCKLHALHLAAETIRKRYPEVNELIVQTKAVFFKSPKRIREFHRQCPGIPQPPQPILTHSGTWLQAAFYYFEHFQQIKTLILQFNSKEAGAIKQSQIKLQDTRVSTDLQTIHKNYFGLVEAIEKLQNPSLSLVESLQILDDVHSELNALNDEKNHLVIEKFNNVLYKDSDFIKLRKICSNSDDACSDPLYNFKDYFNYANVTSLDVERSFSLYKKIFSSQRTSLSEKLLETYQMVQVRQFIIKNADFLLNNLLVVVQRKYKEVNQFESASLTKLKTENTAILKSITASAKNITKYSSTEYL